MLITALACSFYIILICTIIILGITDTTQHYLHVMFNDTVWLVDFKGISEPLKFDPRNVSS